MGGRILLAFIIFTATAGTALSGVCPSDYSQQLSVCVNGMRSLGPNPTCSEVRGAFSCIAPIMTNCQSQPGVAEMSRIINMDSLQLMVDRFCANGVMMSSSHSSIAQDENCPRDYLQQMQTCSRQLKGASNPVNCGELMSSVDCLDNILTSCPNQPGVSALSSAFNFDQFREMVSLECQRSSNPETPVVESGDCPTDYMQQLSACSNQMQAASNSGNCGEMESAIDCMENITESCTSQPGISAMSSNLNFDQIRGMFSARCPPGGATVAPVVEVEGEGESNPSTMEGALGVPDNQLEGPDGGEEIPESESPRCPHENTSARLTRCNKWLQSVNKTKLAREVRCRNFKRGLRCFWKLARKCSADPVVARFLSMVDLDATRRVGDYYCPTDSSS